MRRMFRKSLIAVVPPEVPCPPPRLSLSGLHEQQSMTSEEHARPPTCPSTRSPVRPPARPPAHPLALAACLPACPSARPAARPSAHLLVCLSARPPAVRPSACPPARPPVRPPARLFAHPPARLPARLPSRSHRGSQQHPRGTPGWNTQVEATNFWPPNFVHSWCDFGSPGHGFGQHSRRNARKNSGKISGFEHEN